MFDEGNVTQEFLLSLFRYEDGKLYYLSNGKEAGSIGGQRYYNVKINGKSYKRSRLIFLMLNGYLPEVVDHIDRDRQNDKRENLRASNYQKNQYNTKLRKDNRSGTKGVTWDNRNSKWTVNITFNKKQKYLGRYDDLELAVLVANEAREKFHGKHARYN
jgi:hypothetical protein